MRWVHFCVLVYVVVQVRAESFTPTTTADGSFRCYKPTDIWPQSVSQLALDVNNKFIAYNVPGRGVNIMNLSTKQISQFKLNDLNCRYKTNTANFSYFSNFGHSIATATGWMAVGAPNLDKNFVDNSLAYSNIKLFPIPLDTKSIGEDIYDFTTPDLGTVVSAPEDGSYLVSYHDEFNFAIYQPVLGRASGMLNNNNTNYGDSLVTIPFDFWFDSASVSNTMEGSAYVFVTGCSDLVRQGVFVLYKYTFASHALEALTKDTEDGTRLNFTAGECNLTPTAEFPVRLTPTASRAIVGSPASGCVQLFEFGEEGPKEQVGLNFTTLCVSPDLIGMQFGRAVDFVDDGTVVVSDNNRIFVLDWEHVWQFMSSCSSCHLSDLGTEYSFPNRKQYPTYWGRQMGSLGAGANAIAVTAASDPGSVNSVSPLYVLETEAGHDFDTDLLAQTKCFRGTYKEEEGFTMCAYCPPLHYQDEEGAKECHLCNDTEYCPLGSPTNEIHTAELEDEDTLEAFPAEAAEHESFEETLIVFLFSPNQPILGIAIGFFALIVILDLIYQWRKKKGDTIEKRYMQVMWVILRMVKWVAETEVKQKELEEELKGEKGEHHEDSSSEPPPTPRRTFLGKSKLLADSGGFQTARPDKKHHHHHLPKKEIKVWGGICAIIFYFYVIVAIIFTILFFETYHNRHIHLADHAENIRLSSTSVLRGRNQGEHEHEEIIDNLLESEFNLTVDFVGYSGFNCTSAIFGFSVTNCYTSEFEPCSTQINSSTIISLLTEDACSLVMRFPETITLPATIKLSLPPTTYTSAIRVKYSRYLKNETVPEEFIEEESISTSVFSFISKHLGSETATQISGIPNSAITLIPFLYLKQTNKATVTEFHTRGFVSASTNLAPRLSEPEDYMFVGPFDDFSITLNIDINTFYIINTEERAVQLQYVFLVLVLGIIGVLHVLEFIESFVNKIMYVIKTTGSVRRKRREKAARKLQGKGIEMSARMSDSTH